MCDELARRLNSLIPTLRVYHMYSIGYLPMTDELKAFIYRASGMPDLPHWRDG